MGGVNHKGWKWSESRHLADYKPFKMPMFLSLRPIFGLSHKLQLVFNQLLGKAFCGFWVRGRSHSGFLKINGINLHSTFPGEIQLSDRCDLMKE
jgi:hypothetical protein